MEAVERAADIMQGASAIVAFTGAGVSTESNIPDFRSADGLYSCREKYGFPPEVILSRSFFSGHPDIFYDYYKNNLIHREALPNDCHKALAAMEKAGRLKAVVTQNIDGLHQAAGSSAVLELHGSIYRNYCAACGKRYELERVAASPGVPLCASCGGIIRPDVVLYEEMLDQEILSEAVSRIEGCDVLLVLGTSLVVYPAAGLVNHCGKGRLIIVNRSETAFDNKAALVIRDYAGRVMRNLTEKMGISI